MKLIYQLSEDAFNQTSRISRELQVFQLTTSFRVLRIRIQDHFWYLQYVFIKYLLTKPRLQESEKLGVVRDNL